MALKPCLFVVAHGEQGRWDCFQATCQYLSMCLCKKYTRLWACSEQCGCSLMKSGQGRQGHQVIDAAVQAFAALCQTVLGHYRGRSAAGLSCRHA